MSVQGSSVDLGGYYFVDREKTDAVMRPSETFNAAIETLARACVSSSSRSALGRLERPKAAP